MVDVARGSLCVQGQGNKRGTPEHVSQASSPFFQGQLETSDMCTISFADLLLNN
jgi:hypothetical protein